MVKDKLGRKSGKSHGIIKDRHISRESIFLFLFLQSNSHFVFVFKIKTKEREKLTKCEELKAHATSIICNYPGGSYAGS